MLKLTDASEIRSRIMQIREIMKEHAVDVYIINTGDYHMSEYAGAYFAGREYLSGFTGSAGTLVITDRKAALFTDGRYFVQAEAQLAGTGIELMRMGMTGVLDMDEYCIQELPDMGCIGFDGRMMSAVQGMKFVHKVLEKNGTVNSTFCPLDAIWKERPEFPHSSAYQLDEKYAGVGAKDKIVQIRLELDKAQVDSHVFASLDDICWILNIRGNDVACNPVIMAYMYISQEQAVLYADKNRFDEKLITYFSEIGVILKEYAQIYEDLQHVTGTVWVDMKRVNMRLYQSISKEATKYEKENITVRMKAIKNPVEIKNLRSVHIDDGLAVTKFMYWLKKNMGQYGSGAAQESITEYDAAMYLDHLRSEIPDYIELSFPTISAYNANAAMMHYSATKEQCAMLKPEGVLLVDSGGQYLRGTTDITRTFSLGPVEDIVKKHFTLTLKGMLNLTHAHFLKGCTGFNLDILARQPLWDEGIDYRCGTGHGIGYLLNVHESPNGFRWKHNPGVNDLCMLEQGMVTSNEPGVYIDGHYGIRIENEIVCQEDNQNEYGIFMKFDTLTYVPIDLDLVDVTYLDERDIVRLNTYHKQVYEQLSGYMQGDELAFLKKYTREIRK